MLLDVDAMGKVTDSRDALAGQCAYNLGRAAAAASRPSGRVGTRLIWTAFFAAFPETLAAMPPGPLSDQEHHDHENDPLGGGGASDTEALVADDFLTLSDGLVDSAFNVWDRRSDRCRTFSADLACTWSDERHCFSIATN